MKIIEQIVVVGTLFLMPMITFGQEGGGGPCAEDTKKFCKDVQPGGGRILKCLKEHETELSQACKDQRAQMKEKIIEKLKDFQAACKDDIQSHCKEVKVGGGRILKCLKENESS